MKSKTTCSKWGWTFCDEMCKELSYVCKICLPAENSKGTRKYYFFWARPTLSPKMASQKLGMK